MSQPTYIDVILPLPLANTYTYLVPEELAGKLQPGMRVVVPLGNRKIYTGIVFRIHTILPSDYTVKPIIGLLDDEAVLCRPQLRFWEWIAAYYQCTLGEVYKAALPASMKLESETMITLNAAFEDDVELSDKEGIMLDALSANPLLTVSALQKQTGIKNIMPLLKQLIEKRILTISEELKESYRPKTETYIRLPEALLDEELLKETFDKLEKSPKQLHLLMAYIDLSGVLLKTTGKKEVSKKHLLEKSEITPAILHTLIKKGIFETYKKDIGRLNNDEPTALSGPFPLNTFQQKALQEVLISFNQHNVTLLHGVTSSGKTEVYIHLIQEALRTGKQVLYLVPEIALTAQITTRLKRVFGKELGIYHSKFSDNERAEIWDDLLHQRNYKIILGVRSSIFLPFSKLGLVIVDEEHENTYKQFDPAPRYHARNAAIILASMHGAKTLLGTATPAIETYNNAISGKYGYVELAQRHKEIELPEIVVVDTKELKRKKLMKSHYSPFLLEKIQEALEKEEQVILFQNRRGFAPYVECTLCAWVPKCKNCDVSLTYHKSYNQLSCHYCGYTYVVPKACPSCNNVSLATKGFGTEKIETDIEELFPQARIVRMDLDSTRTKHAYERIISDFEHHNVDILVGTQMISKGLDFEKVSIVGVLNADSLLNFPDFRAHERAFQLLTQVSGRAGRQHKRGLVVIQTTEPNHPIIKQVTDNDYQGMFDLQSQERKLFNYPPYCRLMYLFVKHKDAAILDKASALLASELNKVLGSRVLGPEKPSISRIKNFYIKRFLIKIEMQASADKAKQLIRNAISTVQSKDEFRSVFINFDVDPM